LTLLARFEMVNHMGRGTRYRVTLSFGALAAEREKPILSSVFVRSTAFDRVASGSKIIVLGDRGAGKTALLAMLSNRITSQGGLAVTLAPEDFAYELLRETTLPESAGAWNKSGAYAAAWKHLLYLLAMKKLVGGMHGKRTAAARRVYGYVRDHHANVDINPLGALISYLKRLEGIKIGKLEASLKVRELQRLYRLEEISAVLDDLDEVARTRPIYLLIDELDRGWDASEDAISYVSGLFQAATGIAVRTPHIRVVMSLRRELYDNIPALYEDAQKARDAIEAIDWDRSRLFEMLCRRIRFSLGLAGESDQKVWARVMPRQVCGQPSFDYLADLTLLRPRELIQLCSQIQDTAAEPDRLPYTTDDIREAETVYCRDRCADIVAEYRFQYPGLHDVIETFRGLPGEQGRDELELHCLELAVGQRAVGERARWVLDADPDHLIEVLWRVGLLKCGVSCRPDGPDPAGIRFVGPYEIRTVNTRDVRRFRVHPVFASYLGCR
jgi:hypothetical protein